MQEVEAWLWQMAAARHEHLAHLEAPPFLDAARALLAEGSQLNVRHKGLLKPFIAGSFSRGGRPPLGPLCVGVWPWPGQLSCR